MPAYAPERDRQPFKPSCQIPHGANIFEIIGTARKVLLSVGQKQAAGEMVARATNQASYMDAIAVCCEYVDDGGEDQ